MAGGSGSFFKNCKSEKVGEYVRGRQEGSRRREGEKNRDRRHGIKDVLFLKSFFFNIYLCWFQVHVLETNLNLPTVLFKKWDDWDLSWPTWLRAWYRYLLLLTKAWIVRQYCCRYISWWKMYRRESDQDHEQRVDWKRWWSWRCAGFKASDFNIQELRTAIRQVIMLWFIPEEIQISLSQWNVNYESYEWIWNSISRQGPMFCRLPWPTLSQLHANENPLLRRFWSFTFMLQRRHNHFFTKWWDLQHSK